MTKHILLPLALTLAMASLLPACGADPLEEKETALARKAATEGVLTTTQHYDFTQWLETPDGYSLPTIGKGDTPTATYWASASNQGYTFLAQGKSDFPVTPLLIDGHAQGASIRTVKGAYFFGIGSNVVAGSLYTGAVDKRKLISSSLESSLFGQPYTSGVPEWLEFRYQYKSGATVIQGQNRRVELPATDKGSVSIVLYEITDDASYLNGLTLQSDPRIVAKGYTELEATPEGQWRELELRVAPVDAARYARIDFAARRYRLALVFASSYRGAEFIGALGSELRLQDVRIKDRVKSSN